MSLTDRWERLTKYRVLVGTIFIVFPIGIPWYYGNLATYNESYFRFTPGLDTDDVDTTWMLSSFFIGLCFGQLLSGFVADKIGLLKTFLFSNIIFDLGVFFTFYSVQYSVALSIFTLMALPGFCSGIVFALSFALVAAWFRGGKHVGIASSFVSVAFSAGAIVFNEMCTFFVNPKNLVPDYTEGNMVYFSQPEILDRYPYVFLPIGFLSVFFQVIGMPLLKTPPPAPRQNAVEEKGQQKSASVTNADTDRNCDQEYNIVSSPVENVEDVRASSNDVMSSSKNGFHRLQSDTDSNTRNANGYATFSDKHNPNTASSVTESKTWNSEESKTEPEDTEDVKPMDAVRTTVFKVLVFASFSMAMGYLAVNNYYKLFGQLWIDDDSFLATIGSISTITGAVTRICTGIAVDKIGLKNTAVIFCSTYTFFMSFWYLSVRAHRVFYMLFTNALSGVLSCSFIIFPLGALQYFGHRHYPTNYGLLMMSTLFANIVAPLVFPLFISHLGWFWLFISISMLGPVITVLVIVLIP